MAKGGFWNTAGRRSGGYKPTPIYLGPHFCVCRKPDCVARFICPECRNDMLPKEVTRGCDMCRLIVERHRKGELK